MQKKLFLLFHTVRFLKPIQWYWRLYLGILRFLPFSTALAAPVTVFPLVLRSAIAKHRSFSHGHFVFLHEAKAYTAPMLWNDASSSKLWLYNLHYFDYINQAEIDDHDAFALINDWIKQNPVISGGNGWEPYTLSLRIVNWIKFLSRHKKFSELNDINGALFLQARFLMRHLEYHLLGNHLFKNGVALIYAGAYFSGEEATTWLRKGVEIVTQQVEEQVLHDGGHFERSPMYHVLILEDLLDCLNVNQGRACFTATELNLLETKAQSMLRFLAAILHQDGDIPFFNDGAFKIAPNPADVFNFAKALGFANGFQNNTFESSIIAKPNFGLYCLQNAIGKMIFDAGDIGPDYLPGHAHCDSLSFELSLAGHRCIVNSGTYQYAGQLRNTYRATRAHNSVRLDGEEQHEIWSTFRVARRGYAVDIKVLNAEGVHSVSAAHTGYQRLPGKPIHRREVVILDKGWLVKDAIEGSGEHHVESFIHLHPAVNIVSVSNSAIFCAIEDVNFCISLFDGVDFTLEEGDYSPEFGLSFNNKVVVLRKTGVCPVGLSFQIVMN